MIHRGERVSVSRYSDGEFYSIANIGSAPDENNSVLPDLLRRSIATKGQLVCINFLKPKNIESNDKWTTVQSHLMHYGQQDMYGCCNWNIYDFQNSNKIMPLFFSGKSILLTRYASESRECFSKQKSLEVYETQESGASLHYSQYLKDLYNMCSSSEFKNVLLACGPIGKVLLADLTNEFPKCNFIDVGANLNAILSGYFDDDRFVNQWTMSWAKNVDLRKCALDFLSKVQT